jgi:hypothetical protein
MRNETRDMAQDRNRDSQPFTAPERDYIRAAMGMHFSHYPTLAEGMYLHSWHSGPLQGQARLPKAVQSMLARGLVEIVAAPPGWRAMFTEAGLAALREMAQDRRALDPARFPYLRAELGLEPATGADE